MDDLTSFLTDKLVQGSLGSLKHPKRNKKPAKLCIRCPIEKQSMARPGSKSGLCLSCAGRFSRWKQLQRELEVSTSELTVEKFINECPSRQSVSCLRCPPQLRRKGSSGKGLCRCCLSHFGRWKKRYLANHSPGTSEPTVQQFIEQSPSYYGKKKKPCLRCPAKLGRMAVALNLCRGCITGFYTWKKTYRGDHSEESDTLVSLFVEQYPSRYSRVLAQQVE